MNKLTFQSLLVFEQILRRHIALLLFFWSVLFALPFAQAEEAPQFVAAWGNDGRVLQYPNDTATDAAGNVYVADTSNHQIKKFTSDGTFVSKWGTQGTADGQFNSPQGIAIDVDGNVYVTDLGNSRIQKFTNDGTFLSKWGIYGSADGQFRSLRGIATDIDSNVYVVDSGNNRIQKFTTDGVFLTKWGSFGSLRDGTFADGTFADPSGIATDAVGNVYVVDRMDNRIQKFTSDGTFLSKWGTQGSADEQFVYPAGIATDIDSNVYVTDSGNSRIQKFTNDGTFLSKWGTSGTADGQFSSLQGIETDVGGNVYAADAGNNRIQKFSGDGTFLSKLGTPGTDDGQLNYPRDIAADTSGNLYVADTQNHRIQKFTNDGTFLSKWGTQGSADGQFNYPQGIATDAAGNVYVADTPNHRIQKFTNDGTFLSKWGTQGSADGQFNSPAGIATDTAGNVYVADTPNHRIQKFTNDGTFLSKWGTQGSADGQFNYPQGIATDIDGNVYVVDSNNRRIQVFTSDGTFVKKWIGLRVERSTGIETDTAGNVYVTDGFNQIQKVTSDGTLLSQWGTPGSADGQFNRPTGIATDSAGSVYVADTYNHRIQKFVYVPPSSPTLLTASTWSANQIFLSWNDTSINETGFLIERCQGENCTQFAEVTQVAGNTTSFSDTGLAANMTYTYRVRAVNSAGNSGYSNTASATTLPIAPAAPAGLVATAFSSTQINLNWTDASDNETGFIVERCQGDCGSGFAVIASVAADTTVFSDSGLIAETSYTYRVYAANAGGNSDYSNSASATTLPLVTIPPASPSALVSTAVSSNQVDLDWADASNNEDGFKIERCSGSRCKNFIEVASVGANVTYWSDTTVVENTVYQYRIRAYNNIGNSAYSNVTRITTPASLPVTPTNLTATATSKSQIKLNWVDNSSNETQFKIERCQGVDCSNFIQIKTVSSNTVTYSDKGLSSQTVYRYRVRSSNSAGDSEYSGIAIATTP
jgi:tripartite motif-containing protein 71